MNRKTKLILLTGIILVLAIAVTWQSLRFYRSLNTVRLPTQQSRQLSEMGIYNWMTVDKLSSRLGVGQEKIFEILEIKPVKTDYRMTIRELRKKYNKSPDQMRNNLKRLMEYSKQNGGINE